MAFGSGLDSSDDIVSDINMVPLIDVMLVLLIIFIITVPVLTHSVKLDLPRAENTPNVVKPQTVNLSACTYRIAFGPRAGQKVLTLQGTKPSAAHFKQNLCANLEGFSLHAVVRCTADQRKTLERLCRYVTRPPCRPRRARGPAPRQAQTVHWTVCVRAQRWPTSGCGVTPPIARATSSPLASWMSKIATLAPAAASASAEACPKPEAPPVTTALMLESIFISFFWLFGVSLQPILSWGQGSPGSNACPDFRLGTSLR